MRRIRAALPSLISTASVLWLTTAHADDITYNYINIIASSIGSTGAITGVDSTPPDENIIKIQIPAQSELTVDLGASSGGAIISPGLSGVTVGSVPANGYFSILDEPGSSITYFDNFPGGYTVAVPGYLSGSLFSTPAEDVIKFVNNQPDEAAVADISFYESFTSSANPFDGAYRVTPILNDLHDIPGGTVSDPLTLAGDLFGTRSSADPFSGPSYIAAHMDSGSTNNFYEFYWTGGVFSTSAIVYSDSDTGELDPSDIFTLELFETGGALIYSEQLTDPSACVFQCRADYDGYLPAGYYTIGVNGYSPTDPELIMYFPGSLAAGTPEPSTWAMVLLGFAGLSFASYRTARRRPQA
jgi:hypothetical protein